MMREPVSELEPSRQMRRTEPAVHRMIEDGRIADAPVPIEDGRERLDHARVCAILADDHPDMPLPKRPLPDPERYRQLVCRRSRRVGCCPSYATATTPVISTRSAKARARAPRYSAAAT